jgi:hypothetical protein
MLVKSAVITPNVKDAAFNKDSTGFDSRAYEIPFYKVEKGEKKQLLEPILAFLNEKLQVTREGKTIDLVV